MEPHYYNVDVNWNQDRKGIMCSPELNRDANTCIEIATPAGVPQGHSRHMVPRASVHCCGKQLFDDHFFGHSGKFKTGVFKF